MRKAWRFAFLAFFLMASPPAVIAHQTTGETIVVRGTPVDQDRARQRAVDFVKRTGVANGQKQVARWVVPVCMKIIGLRRPHAARVEQIMRGIAREANIKTAGPKCEANITVSFAADPGKVVRYINARRPHQLRELPPAAKERLLTGETPVRWWYATSDLDRDGVPANNISAPWISMGGTTSPLPTVDGVTTTQQYNSGSNVRTPTIRALYGATVVIDTAKAGETPIDTIAAYTAMVAFAEIDAAAPPPDSILTLFQADSIESSLTDWDLAFLKSLYRMPLDRRSRIQRGHLVEALLDERLPRSGVTKLR
ncbi:MAG: hypothetical protein M3Q19_12045 [Pseudomonadota bacterium]|nr:hypothetical protein [Pseudomonadota bacterium]